MVYKGDLAKPMEPPVIGILATDKQISKVADKESDELVRRYELLFAHYAITFGDWQRLAMALAREHVPGFRYAQAKAGAKRTWHSLDRAELKVEIDEMIKEAADPAKGVNWAAGILASKPGRWKDLIRKHSANPAEVLRRAYYNADPRCVSMVRDARAYDELMKKSDEQDPSQNFE